MRRYSPGMRTNPELYPLLRLAVNLALMKPTACLINMARGPVVVQSALYDALVNQKLGRNSQPVRLLLLGGGGYVFPNYLFRARPGSELVVVEIDPGVTRAAQEAFGLPPDAPLEIHHQDARNYVADALRPEQRTVVQRDLRRVLRHFQRICRFANRHAFHVVQMHQRGGLRRQHPYRLRKTSRDIASHQ